MLPVVLSYHIFHNGQGYSALFFQIFLAFLLAILMQLELSLIDVRMPKMNGFDLYKEIIKLDSSIKVTFITAFEVNYRAWQEIFPNLAQESYISKPTTMKGLKEHVHHLLEESH
jgi:two-component SAPR family response regulator